MRYIAIKKNKYYKNLVSNLRVCNFKEFLVHI